jgi:hypothetical protein
MEFQSAKGSKLVTIYCQKSICRKKNPTSSRYYIFRIENWLALLISVGFYGISNIIFDSIFFWFYKSWAFSKSEKNSFSTILIEIFISKSYLENFWNFEPFEVVETS